MPKICVVEDENSIAEMVRFNLEMESYEVELIQDGAEALELFKRNFEFDLIILDVMLPNVSGVDLCRLIRQTSQVPILFLSAKGTTADRIEGLKAGGNDYLPKPFDLEDLIAVTQRAISFTKDQRKACVSEVGISDNQQKKL